MSEQTTITQDDKVLAALAHGSILLGAVTSGIGGIVAALIIWLTQKDKSAYAAAQALQALVYQVAVTLLTFVAWCCWGLVWMAMFLPPIMSNPEAYQNDAARRSVDRHVPDGHPPGPLGPDHPLRPVGRNALPGRSRLQVHPHWRLAKEAELGWQRAGGVMNQLNPSREDRTMAALAHGSGLLPGMGVVAAVVIWATQKGTSRYVNFQALQAIVYQMAGLLVQIVGWCCWTALYLVSFIPMIAAAEAWAEPPAIFWISMLLMVVPFALMGLWIVGSLWGAIRTLQGRDFRYLWVGTRLERWLTTS